jgi:hypothetical protein
MIYVSLEKYKIELIKYNNIFFTKVPSLSVIVSSPFDDKTSSEGAINGRFNWPKKTQKN